jgi:hypothetical protein
VAKAGPLTDNVRLVVAVVICCSFAMSGVELGDAVGVRFVRAVFVFAEDATSRLFKAPCREQFRRNRTNRLCVALAEELLCASQQNRNRTTRLMQFEPFANFADPLERSAAILD